VTAWTAFASVAGVVTVLLLLLSHSTSQGFGERPDSSREGRPRFDERDGHGADGAASLERTPVESVASEGEAGVESGVDGPVRSGASAGFEGDVDGSVGRDAAGLRDEESGAEATGRSEATPWTGGASGEREVRGDGDVGLPGGREQALARELSGTPALSQSLLLVNVALSQGLFAVVIVAAAVLGEVPRAALGVGDAQLSGWLAAVGVALGAVLYAANEAGGALADAAGLGRSEDLRELLAPESPLGWVVLLGGVLPIVAGFEELLFRGVLVGAFATGFGVSPWLLVVGSSVLFGLGHGAQGRLGVLVTGALGVVLGVAFVLTGSLLVVVVAHYLVNALEFVVHEGPFDGLGWR